MALDPALLHRSIDDWPLLLAGPIVRRVTRTSAAVFLAAREPFTVTLTLNLGTGPDSDRLPGAEGVAVSVALGGSLHVCVVEARGLALQPGVLYGYGLELETADGSHTLGSLGLLSEPVPLGYVAGDLPGFLLPGSLDDLRVVQSSCRKAHGGVEGTSLEPDLLAVVDRLIGDARLDPTRRPQQVFLTGDQLYSDDVPAAVLAAATSLGRELLAWGRPEVFPDRRESEEFTDDHVRIEPGARSWFLDDQGVKDRPEGVEGLKDYAANHLLFLGEWYALYLLTWSPVLWQTRDAVDPDDRAAHPDHSYHVLPETADVLTEEDDPPDTTTASLVFAQSLAFVRRALANVATYMVFDDHDVTDDWLLNGRVAEQQRGRGETPGPGGRRMMRNALAAYAVFQHWGNVPDDFTTASHGGRLLELLDAQGPEAVDDTPLLGQAGHETDADAILDVGAFPLGIARRDERLRWDFELVFDHHRLLFLDTRTWRGYPPAPPPLDPEALLQAAEERVEVAAEWGPEALDELAAAWVTAAEDVGPSIAALLTAGASLLDTCAALARTAQAGSAGAEAQAADVIEAAAALLDAVLTAPAIADFAVVETALTRARDGLLAGEGAHPDDPLPDVFRAASALNAAAFALRAGLADWLRAAGLATLSAEALAFRSQMEALAVLLEAASGFLQGAAVSVGRAARYAARMAGAWLSLAGDAAGALWGQLGQAAAAALGAAATVTAPVQERLEAAAAAHRAVVDPVWKLLVGEGANRQNAELISLEALDFQVRERVADPARQRELTLVISPAPVFGHWLVELIQRGMLIKTELQAGDADTEWENEPWSGNVPAWAAVLDALTPLESVVFLSGDVHYAFSTVNDYCPTGFLGLCRFVQLTSSPTKNLTANSVAAEVWDETHDDLVSALHLQFDFLKLLPSAEELLEYPAAARGLVPSQDEVETAVRERLAASRETFDDWWASEWDFGIDPLMDLLRREREERWDDVQVQWAQTVETVLEHAAELRWDPLQVLLGDRLLSAPFLQEQSLLLLQSLGIDPEHLVEAETTVLRDARAEERLDDGPELRARIEKLLPHRRNVEVRRARTTIAQHNIGVVSTQATPLGRFVIHDLHWFPLPEQDEPTDPGLPGAVFRGDWMITRHMAGLLPGMPADGALVGVVPGAGPGAGGGTGGGGSSQIEIDVTSPRQSTSGAARIHPIAFAGPTMPELTVRVTLPELSDQEASALSRDVRLVVSYVEGNRNDVLYLPGPGPDAWHTLPAGVDEWRPAFAEFAGGDLQVFARAAPGGEVVAADTGASAHRIWGENPPKADVRTHAARGSSYDVVFHRESRFTQFSDDASTLNRYRLGPLTVLRAADNGFGLGQLTIPPPTRAECWNWHDNVADSLRRLDGFRADALTYQAQVQQGLPWDDATGRRPPSPPNEGQAFPDAPDFTDDELDLEMWCRYNSGRRFHDYDPTSESWVRQPSTSAGLTYATEVLAVRQAVDAGNLPAGWG